MAVLTLLVDLHLLLLLLMVCLLLFTVAINSCFFLTRSDVAGMMVLTGHSDVNLQHADQVIDAVLAVRLLPELHKVLDC